MLELERQTGNESEAHERGARPDHQHPSAASPSTAARSSAAQSAGLRSARSRSELVYAVIDLVPSILFFVLPVTLLAVGLGLAVIWHGYLPEQTAPDGSLHRGMQWWPDFFVDSWASMAVLALIGAGVLCCAPRVVGFLTTIDRMLIAALLSAQDRGR